MKDQPKIEYICCCGKKISCAQPEINVYCDFYMDKCKSTVDSYPYLLNIVHKVRVKGCTANIPNIWEGYRIEIKNLSRQVLPRIK